MKNFKALSNVQMNTIKGGSTTITDWGYDDGGYFVIVDDGSSCRKEYINELIR